MSLKISFFFALIFAVYLTSCQQGGVFGKEPDKKPIVFEAISVGTTPLHNIHCAGGAAFIRDEEYFYSSVGCGRSFNVAVIDPVTTEVIHEEAKFDTWIDGKEQQRMIDFIESFPDGVMLMIAVGDTAGARDILVPFLESLGSKMIRDYRFRDSWAMIVIKGTGEALAEDLKVQEHVEIKVSL